VAETRNTSAPQIRLNLAQAYIAAGQTANAIGIYQQVLERGDRAADPWRVQLAIAELYAQLGDIGAARANAALALQAAPESDKPQIQAWLDQLPP
jgi:FimV-like protein